jgi:proline racemase
VIATAGHPATHKTYEENSMRYDRSLSGFDFHTGGQGMRLLTAGLDRIDGDTMNEKLEYFRQQHDDVRQSLCAEPRGSQGLLMAVVTEPVSAEASFGLLYMTAADYLQACGELTIGAVTALVETGFVTPDPKTGEVVVDGPAGTIRTVPSIENGRVREVALIMPTSYVIALDEQLVMSNSTEISVDLCYGAGNIFAMVDAASVGLSLELSNAEQFRMLGGEIRRELNARGIISKTTKTLPNRSVDMVEFYTAQDAEGTARNVVIWDDPAYVNRAPCGTGTCARLAQMSARGQLQPQQSFTQRGILGTHFTGSYEHLNTEGNAVTPTVTGSARVTGVIQHLFHDDDPMKTGYLLPA